MYSFTDSGPVFSGIKRGFRSAALYPEMQSASSFPFVRPVGAERI